MAIPTKQGSFEESGNMLSPELPVQWEKGRIIGRGGCGTVYLVRDLENTDKELFVVKEIFVTENNIVKITKQFKTETTILRTSETHPRIVQFFGYYQKDNIFSIFLQYLKKGSLTDYIHKNGKLQEPKIQIFTRQILEAVVFLHEHNIIHRDIKGQNILLEDEENIKLTDFGISKILEDVTSTYTAIGTYRWMAPEVANANNSTHKYNKKADIWSIGCTVVEMITGKIPYSEYEEDVNVVYKITNNKEPPQYKDVPVSDNCEHFLKKTFTVDPLFRPNAKDLLDTDQFLNKYQTAYTVPQGADGYCLVIKTRCQKHPGHKEFVPVNLFDISHISHLPNAYQDNELVELIKAVSELTVLVHVRFTSYDRNEDYPYYRSAGTDFLRKGSGMIDFEMYDGPNDKCYCRICQSTGAPNTRSFTFNVVTATHVVFDDSEAVKTRCTLFYDDKSNGVYVEGLSIESVDVNTDRCVLKCISHSIVLKERLSKAWEKYKKLNRIVTSRYKHRMEENKLCVVISHPHGESKCVTVGEWTKMEVCGRVPKINIPFTRYHYTTATCQGSAGAPVFILGSGTGMYHHTHSGGVVDDNYSGLFFD